MHATLRQYEGIDQTRVAELKKSIDENLAPQLSNLPGFAGYYVIESGNGVFTSLGLFEEPAQGEESSRVAANWVRDQKLEGILPTPPKVTSGAVLTSKLKNGVVSA